MYSGNNFRIIDFKNYSVNYQLSTRINDRQGSMRIENGYYNKDYGFLC